MLSLTPAFVATEPLETQGLLEQARAGDMWAFCELCREHEPRLLRQALALCANSTLAEELAQDTLVEAWRCLRRYNGRCQFFTWLCAILLHRFRNTLRQKRPLPFSSLTRPEQDQFQNHIATLADGGPLPDESSQLRERAELLRRCIAALPPKHQQVIYLRFYVDDSLEGIAAALDCSVGTVKSRLFHALEKLRNMHILAAHAADTKGNP